MNDTLFLRLQLALTKQQLTLDESKVNQLTQFLGYLHDWNQVFNLTGLHEEEESIYLHIIDSLLVAPYVRGQYCLDVGSGGGFPGVPLAILFPNKRWILLDKSNKKIRFLTHVIAQLSLTNIEAVHARCQDFQFPRGFDSILSRAFATLPLMLEMTTHLLHPVGGWIAMKGQYPTEELAALPDTVYRQVYQLHMIGADVTRHVVCINPKKS